MQIPPFLLVALLPLAGPALAQDVIPLPLLPRAPGPVAGSLDLDLDLDLIGVAHDLDQVVMEGFPHPEGAVYDLRLERITYDFSTVGVFVDGVASDWDPGDLSMWKGSIVGVPASEAYLALSSRGSYGWVFDGIDYTHLTATPGERGDWSRPGARIFTDRALVSAGDRNAAVQCRLDELTSGPTQMLVDGGQSFTGSQTLECKIAVETDYQLYQIWNNLGAEQAYVMALIGAASDRYLSQVDVILTYPYVMFYTNANDPWTSQDNGGDSVDLLYEFRAAWQFNIPNGGHLGAFLSGASLGGGVAWLDVLCDGNYGFNVSGNINGGVTFPVQQGSNTWDFVVFTHEGGHNFGTNHTHAYCPPLDECAPSGYWGQCQDEQKCITNGTLMGYCHLCNGGMNNVTTYFHPTVVNVMRTEAENSCLPDYGGGGPEELFSDGFESGDFAGGGWNPKGPLNTKIKPKAARTGSWGARMRKKAWVEKAIDTSTYEDIVVSFSWRAKNYDSGGEEFTFEFWDGAAWNTVATKSTTGWVDTSFNMPAAADDNASFKIRFRSSGDRRKERGDLDDVTVTGTPL